MAESKRNMQNAGPTQKEAPALDDERLQALEAEAAAEYEMGRLDRALAKYEEILAEEPGHAGALTRVGAIRAQKGDLDGAETALRQAIALNPELAGAHSNLGNILLTRGDAQGALALYKEAVRLDPDSAVFHENLAAAYKRLGDITNMVAELKKAQKLQVSVRRKHDGPGTGAPGKRFGCLPAAILIVVGVVAALWLTL